MNNTNLTPGKLVSDGSDIYLKLENGNESFLSVIAGVFTWAKENEEWAKRIVACVNFCEGTTNELLLGRSLDSMNRDLDRLLKLVERKNVELMDSYSLIGQYRGQRDALLRAANKTMGNILKMDSTELSEAIALVKRHDHSKDPMMEALEQILKDSAELPHIHEIARKALEKGGAL